MVALHINLIKSYLKCVFEKVPIDMFHLRHKVNDAALFLHENRLVYTFFM